MINEIRLRFLRSFNNCGRWISICCSVDSGIGFSFSFWLGFWSGEGDSEDGENDDDLMGGEDAIKLEFFSQNTSFHFQSLTERNILSFFVCCGFEASEEVVIAEQL